MGNGVDIVNKIKDTMGEKFPIIGGAAGDQYEFKKTYQFHGTEVLSDSLPHCCFFQVI